MRPVDSLSCAANHARGYCAALLFPADPLAAAPAGQTNEGRPFGRPSRGRALGVRERAALVSRGRFNGLRPDQLDGVHRAPLFAEPASDAGLRIGQGRDGFVVDDSDVERRAEGQTATQISQPTQSSFHT